MKINGLRALVTGASGFIGGRLAERLVMEEGVHVRAMVRSQKKAAWLKKFPVEIVEGDLHDLHSLRKAADRCDLVFHCAAIVRETGDPMEFVRTNVEGTGNIISTSMDARVRLFIHISSIAVHGLDPPDGADENTPLDHCGNLYCDTKIDAEVIVLAHYRNSKLPVVVIRPANVYGPRSNPWTIRPVKLITSGQMMLVEGGTGICNYVYVDNLIDAIIAVTKRDESVGEVYLISDGMPVTWKEFFEHYVRMAGKTGIRSFPRWVANMIAWSMETTSKITGKPPKITRDAVKFLTRKARYSIEKAKADLNYQPRIPLEEGMRITEQWLREEGYFPKK